MKYGMLYNTIKMANWYDSTCASLAKLTRTTHYNLKKNILEIKKSPSTPTNILFQK